MEVKGEWFRESLKKIEFLYKICGLRLYSSDTNFVRIRFIFLVHFFNLNTELGASMFWFIDGLATGKDFITLTYTGPCILYSYMAIIKILLIIREENMMHKLIEQMINIEEKSTRYISSTERKDIIGGDVKFLHSLIKLQNVVHVILLLGFVAAPMSFIAVKYFKTGEIELILPLFALYPFDPLDIRVWPFVYIHQNISTVKHFKTGEIELILPLFALYPFDPLDIRVWPFVYVHQNISTMVVLIYALSADTFLYISCTYINIQFQLLQCEIRRIISSSNNTSLQRIQPNFQEKFKEIVRWHQELMRSAEMLEIIYAKSTLFNFVSSSVSICLTLFNVTVIQDIAYVITFMSFLGMGLLQIFFLCYFGDMISRSSMEVSDAVYHSLWYFGDRPVGKQLFFIMMRSQKPCKLTAHGFADVNLRAFMRIMSNAWSYFALLKTIYH